MTDEDIKDFSRLLQHNAAMFRLPALPGVWPDWMPPEKRRSMADNFAQYALEIDAMFRRRLSVTTPKVENYDGAGELKLAAYRVRDPENGEFSNLQFHATFNNMVLAVMGEESAKLFSKFVTDATTR